MGSIPPSPEDSSDHESAIERTAEFMHEIFAGGSKAKLRLCLKAQTGVPVSTIEEDSKIRTDHVERLKRKCYILEEDDQYKLTPWAQEFFPPLETINQKFAETPADVRARLSRFLWHTDWDQDLKAGWRQLEDSIVLKQDPTTKYSTLIRSASAILAVRQTISIPEEFHYRIQEADRLKPTNVEFIYTNTAMQRVLEDETLFEAAKDNEDSGVLYQFLDPTKSGPNYNLTLVQVDRTMLEELHAPTSWVEKLDLTSWLVVIESIPSESTPKQILISDAQAARDWAFAGETGIYHKYESLATKDSWNDPNPQGPLGREILQ